MNLKGTPLKLEDIENKKVCFTTWQPKIEYNWDCGIAISRYLKELKNGKLIARKCNKCNRTLIPPRMFCELCFRQTDNWIYLKDSGKILTFSTCYLTYDVNRIKEPQICAVIELDGATEGSGIMHLLGEVAPADVKIGMKVRAVWKDEKDRIGAITDIKYFKPV